MIYYPKCLTIAGSDSGGGAGIQADLKTMSAIGVYGMSVITAITAQNTCGVKAIQPIDSYIVTAQLEAVLSDIGTDSIKIGMLHSVNIIKAVYEVCNRGLDGAGSADKGEFLAGLCIEGDVVQHQFVFFIPKVHIIKANVTLQPGIGNGPIAVRVFPCPGAGAFFRLGQTAVFVVFGID